MCGGCAALRPLRPPRVGCTVDARRWHRWVGRSCTARLCFPVAACSKNKAITLVDQVGGTELEKRVRTATSNEHYPTPLSQLQDIAEATHD